MKLKNKQTGEIVDTLCEDITKGMVLFIDHHDGNPTTEYYNSLAELCEEWEDYEEPKEHWMINAFGDAETISDIYTDDMIDELREIGNYFETKEKAELVVRKLKAWKKLKDKELEFDSIPCCNNLCGNGFKIHFSAIMPPEFWNDNDTKKELTFLFRGEE